MLQAIDLTKRYEDGLLALDHVNFEVKEGEIFCLLGANGAGKTTTINLFLNFIDPTEGQALINGIDSAKDPLGAKEHVAKLTVRVGGTAGLYVANWDLWPEYRNLNLATNAPVNANTTFRGTAPGLTFNFGVEYPVGWAGLVAALDMNYLYLNFKNVAWYNASDEEVVVTYNGTADSRVDLALSGVRGKFEIKRYFNW